MANPCIRYFQKVLLSTLDSITISALALVQIQAGRYLWKDFTVFLQKNNFF